MTESSGPRPARSPAEWLTFGISAAILAAVLGLIGIEAFGPETPPAPEVRQGSVIERDGTFVVPVEVINQGDTTIASAQVTASFTRGDDSEESDQVVDFLAGGETVQLEFRFAEDPRRGELDIRVASYQLP